MTPQDIANSDQLMQLASMMLVVGVIILEIIQWKDEPWNVGWIGIMLFWMFHGLFFYIVLFLERYGVIDVPVSYTVWSSILRFHGYITIFSMELTRVLIMKRKKKLKLDSEGRTTNDYRELD